MKLCGTPRRNQDRVELGPSRIPSCIRRLHRECLLTEVLAFSEIIFFGVEKRYILSNNSFQKV